MVHLPGKDAAGQSWRSELFEEEIAERKKCKNSTQNILLQGCYQTFEDCLQERDICLKPAELCRETSQSVDEEMAFQLCLYNLKILPLNRYIYYY